MKKLLIIFTLLFSLGLGVGDNVDAAPHKIIEQKIVSELQLYVAGQLAVDASEIEVDLLRAMSGQKIYPGEILKIRSASTGRLLGRVVFVLRMSQAGKRPFEQWVSANVVQVREVVVTRRKLRRHAILEADDITFQTLRVRTQRSRFESDPARVIGKRITQSLRKGSPIRSEQLEAAPLVRRGEQVTVTLKSEGLQISTTGLAKQDGLLGELIKVLNLDSRKLIFAEVVGAGDVSINLRRGR